MSRNLLHSHSQILEFYINPLSHITFQSILYSHIYTYLCSSVVCCYKHSHQIHIYTYKFHATLYVLFHYFSILDWMLWHLYFIKKLTSKITRKLFFSASLIFFYKSNLCVSYLVFKTNPLVSILFAWTTNLLHTVFINKFACGSLD